VNAIDLIGESGVVCLLPLAALIAQELVMEAWDMATVAAKQMRAAWGSFIGHRESR
jgi:hypothetical protein